MTDQNANVVGRHDYLPFGEEIAANTGGRNGAFGTQDFVNQKFTGQERDSETGLDFFQARYFSPALGRFASPDTPLLDQDPRNPQSWNLYTYVRNNSLNLIDPDGHTCVTATGEPVAPDYPDVKVDNNDGYGCQTIVTVYGGSIDPIRAALSFSNILQLPVREGPQQETRSLMNGKMGCNASPYAPCIPPDAFDAFLERLRGLNWGKAGMYAACVAGVEPSYMTRTGAPQVQDASDSVPETQGTRSAQNGRASTNVVFGPGKRFKNGGHAPINPRGDSPGPERVSGGASYVATVFQCIANVTNNF